MGILAAILAAGALVVITEAPAAANYANCQAGQFCTFWDATGGGAEYYYTGPINQCIEIGAPWDDQISSVYNRTGYNVRVYQEHHCNSFSILLPIWYPGDSGTYTLWKNDSGSSIFIGNP